MPTGNHQHPIITQAEAARVMRITKRQAQVIEARALRKLRKAIEADRELRQCVVDTFGDEVFEMESVA